MVNFLREARMPQTVQALIVVMFSLVVVFLALNGRPVPDMVGFALSAIIGYYFGDSKRSDPMPP